MFYDFEAIDRQSRYKLLGATITPRPIAWVSSISADGSLNAAPFSYFNVFGEDPPIVGFSILSRGADDAKDTGRNVRAQGEFVVNLVGEESLDDMNVTAVDFPPGTSEFEAAGLTPAPSSRVRTPRIAESPVSFECTLFGVTPLGELRSLILGRVVAMHVRDEAVLDPDACHIDTPSLRLVGRAGPSSYVRTTEVIHRPPMSLADLSKAK